MLPWQPFVMNALRNRKVKKLAYFAGYWLDLHQIRYKRYFWILNSKSTIKFLYDVILMSKWHRVKYLDIACEKCIWRHYDVISFPIFVKTLIQFFLKSDYHHVRITKFCDLKPLSLKKGHWEGKGFEARVFILKFIRYTVRWKWM